MIRLPGQIDSNPCSMDVEQGIVEDIADEVDDRSERTAGNGPETVWPD
jgi:hypothetical protein